MDRGVWRATVHGVTQSWTRLEQLSTHARKHIPLTERFISGLTMLLA